METNTNQNKTLKSFFKKTGLIFLFSALLLLNEGCQSKPANHNLIMQDEIRKSHAAEVLQGKSDRSDKNAGIVDFDGDEKLAQYIASYVRKMNSKIDAPKFTQTLMSLSQKHSYDPILILAIIQTESRFNFNAVGSAGEIGLMQIKPKTAEWICMKNNIKWKGAKALKNPEYNIVIGTAYIKYLKKTLNSKSLKYINAYNMGLASMKRSTNLKNHPYFPKVIGNYLSIYSKLNKIKVTAI